MKRFAGACALFAVVYLLPSVSAQGTVDTTLQSASVAWDKGDYIQALTTYATLLDAPDATRVLEPIALQTGELYHTTELTADGTMAQISPDGKYVSYETGVAPKRLTRVVLSTDPAGSATELSGFDAAFSLDSTRLAYLKLAPSATLLTGFAELEKMPALERLPRLAALNLQMRMDAVLTVRDMSSGREVALDTGPLSKTTPVFAAGGAVIFAGAAGSGEPQQLYAVSESAPVAAITTGPGDKVPIQSNSPGDTMIFATRAPAAGRRRRGRTRRRELQRALNRCQARHAAQHDRQAGLLARRPVAVVRRARRRHVQGHGRARRRPCANDRRAHRARARRGHGALT